MQRKHSRRSSNTPTNPAGPGPEAEADRDRIWADLLARAIAEPGLLSRAYRAFHQYSIGNQLLALVECDQRGLDPGPMATYRGWQEKGRQVRRGERAIALWMPIVGKRQPTEAEPDPAPDAKQAPGRSFGSRFIMTPRWFVVGQTDVIPYDDEPASIEAPEPEPIGELHWDSALALTVLEVVKQPYGMVNGNTQGYSNPTARTMAINPVAADWLKTTFHELGHILLHAEANVQQLHADLSVRSQVECEAEAVVLLCLDALGRPGAEHARGYIQHWAAVGGIDRPFDGPTARRIIKAADEILKAGRPRTEEGDPS